LVDILCINHRKTINSYLNFTTTKDQHVNS